MLRLHLGDSSYPKPLAESPRPPPVLFVDGAVEVLSRPAIAIVGTRAPSPYGLRAARHFARALAERGFVVVSGLARGIDTAAHEAALAARGETVAVLGHGLDRVYPAENRGLAGRILKQGCLVAEYPPGTLPLRHHFPARNRILASLAWGTLVVEATPQSGSLITARLALEANREVFAVPGAFDDPGYGGSHALLQQGAKLVVGPEDLCDELPPDIVALAARHARPRRLVCDEAVGELARLFADDEARSLAELGDAYPGDWARLLCLVEKAKAGGCLIEIAPQKFAWGGPRPEFKALSRAPAPDSG